MKVEIKKIPVAILGATGMVGQKFVELLAEHPWFQIVALAASERSVGKSYGEVTRWGMAKPLSRAMACMPVLECKPDFPCRLVFSGLDSSVAGEIETAFANAGYYVISNASNHRMVSDVPLLIPEINSEHLKLLEGQCFDGGGIVTNPNCSVIGLAMAMKPLFDRWGLASAHVVTLQAVSGAGYPGVASMDILDNVIPFIRHEESKVEEEPLKIFGSYNKQSIIPSKMRLTAQCTRVPVADGHLACVSVKLNQQARAEEIIEAWRHFRGVPQQLKLPMAPERPIVYLDDERHPQPKLHRHLEKGMAVSVGRLRPCALFDWKFVVLSHNTIRGAAGGAILNAELMAKQGYFGVFDER